VINIYPGLNISLGAVSTTSVAADSDFVTLGAVWFLYFLRPRSFRSGYKFHEMFCPAQCLIFGQIQKQSNILVQQRRKSGFVRSLRSTKIYCGLIGTGTVFSPSALAFCCQYNSAKAPHSILYHPRVGGDSQKDLSVSVLDSAVYSLL
jgi:hypothetical protein